MWDVPPGPGAVFVVAGAARGFEEEEEEEEEEENRRGGGETSRDRTFFLSRGCSTWGHWGVRIRQFEVCLFSPSAILNTQALASTGLLHAPPFGPSLSTMPDIVRLERPLARADLNPLPEISATAFGLGIVAGAALVLALASPLCASFPSLPLYVGFVAIFHFLEYFCTASYQPARVEASSFVLNDTVLYHVAHGTALAECLLELWLRPSFKTDPAYRPIKLLGLLVTLAGQYVRSLAMKTAGNNFSHVIQRQKDARHVLVTHGIYAYLRHPSYVGFFYWALGTQMLLLNPVSFCLFALLLYRFFSSRIHYEEASLLTFFGKDYANYRKSSHIGIPFISSK